MLAEAQRKADTSGLAVTFRLGDAEAPPADGAPYDVIVERHLIWTLPQPTEAIRAWHALLKPVGLLVLIEGIFEMSDRTVYQHIEAHLPLYMEERKAKTLVCDIFRQQIVHLRLFHPVSNDLLNIPTTDLTGWRLPADDWLSAFLSLFIRLHK